MKKASFLLFSLLLAIFIGCQKEDIDQPFPAEKDREFDNGSSIDFPELNEQLVINLELLGRIWGFLKYHHPAVGEGKYHWDYELFRVLPKYMKVKNNEERDKIILDWINKYGKIPTCSTCKETSYNSFIKPDLLWAENSNMNNGLKEKIKEIYKNRYQGDHYYIRMIKDVGIPEFIHEYSYSNMSYPDAGFRLLSLYRYWNIIHYFYPDKYLAEKDWNDVLKEYIPLFISAENRLEYELVTLKIIVDICDSHAYLPISVFKGNNNAPFRVWFIEKKLVVTDYYNPQLIETKGLKIGDIITHINGETVESIVENLKKYYPASNDARKLHDISFDLFRSNNYSIAINYISSGLSSQKEIRLYDRSTISTYSWYVDKNSKCYKFINDSIGYITIATITIDDIPIIKETFKKAKGIIIDIRNYPPIKPSMHISSSLGSWISGGPYFVKFSYGNTDNPGEFKFQPAQITYSSETFQGKVMVLVNEITLSAAEFFAMTFRAGINTKIIGSRTAGALGFVSSIILPGGLQTQFTGIGYYYPDGTPTQRFGIVPDIWVEPTVEGIRQGRDELMDMAIKLINEE